MFEDFIAELSVPNHNIKRKKDLSDLFCPTATSRGNIQLKCGCTALFCLNNVIFCDPVLFCFFISFGPRRKEL